MIQKKNGFTLVELLAVIVILTVIVLVGGVSTLGIINKARKSSAEEMRTNLKDVAITYVIDNSIKLPKCTEEISKSVDEGRDYVLGAQTNGGCAVKIEVETLKNEGIFEDAKDICKDSVVVVYRYNREGYSEYRAYIADNACE